MKESKSKITRRGFVEKSIASAIGITAVSNRFAFGNTNSVLFGEFGSEKNMINACPITRPPMQHFYGYYTSPQFDITDRYILGLQCDFIGRLQRPDDEATIGMIDTKNDNMWQPLATTKAWNWQMGCQVGWLEGTEKKIVFNDRYEGQFVSTILDISTGKKNVLHDPIYEVAPDGKSALTLNFSRLWDVRPETGYCGLVDTGINDRAPRSDGIFNLDLETGEKTLIISHADMEKFPVVADMPPNAKRYFTHLLFNEDGSRFMFWYRCTTGKGSLSSAIYTALPNGNDICFITDRNSHSTWFGRDKILAWATHQMGSHTYLFTDKTEKFEVFGKDVLNFNGHATFSPDKKWLLTDIQPNQKPEQTLVLYDVTKNRRIDLGKFGYLPDLKGPLRCDLHPRWNRSGTKVCIDSIHEGTRQIYLLDVSEII